MFVIFNNVITVRSEMWVRDFPHHLCQKIPSKSRGEASWFGKNFLALMVRKIPYSHFLLTVISHSNYSKSIRKWILQKCYQFFINEKLKQTSHFFSSILRNYGSNEITKEYWKNIHFENMTAVYTSFNWDMINIKIWQMENQILFRESALTTGSEVHTVKAKTMGPEAWQKRPKV